MSTPKISVIIPVYNADKTIKKCLDSFIAQSLKEWELVLVDDGSSDSSGQICDEYAEKDSRFIVIHQDNAGVSAARQAGLNATTGEYVIHADPDDWVEPSMLEELYNKACEDNADMVICDFFIENRGDILYSNQCPISLNANFVLNNMFGSRTIHGSCCNKLVKKSCIDYCQAIFPLGVNYCEDICFNVQLLKNDIKVTYLNKAFYHYVQNPTSITNNSSRDNFNSLKNFVSFLTLQLSEFSIPVILTKEEVKKYAFRYSVISNKELINLYPEIKSTHDHNPIVRLMYRLAFTNHHLIARVLRKAYISYKK